MKDIQSIAVIVIIGCLVAFLVTINNWDKKIERGEEIKHSENGGTIAKFLLYIFIGAFIAFNLIEMKNCSGSNSIPFEETIRRN